jgi:type IV secretory pathway TrbD component
MKRIKSFFGITAWLVAMMLLALACSDDMDIHKVYAFDLVLCRCRKKSFRMKLRRSGVS